MIGQQNALLRVTCADGRHSNGNTVLMSELGFNSSGKPTEYLWCKLHRRTHACTLEQQLQTYREMSASNPVWRQAYVAVLNKAILDVTMNVDEPQEQSESA